MRGYIICPYTEAVRDSAIYDISKQPLATRKASSAEKAV